MKLLKSLERQEPNVATNTREVLSSASGQALLLARTGSPGVEKVTLYLGDEEVGLFESKTSPDCQKAKTHRLWHQVNLHLCLVRRDRKVSLREA